MENFKSFCTIKETARALGVPHMRIRQWVKAGRVRGFTSGNRYYIDLQQFEAALKRGDFEKAPVEREDEADEGTEVE